MLQPASEAVTNLNSQELNLPPRAWRVFRNADGIVITLANKFDAGKELTGLQRFLSELPKRVKRVRIIITGSPRMVIDTTATVKEKPQVAQVDLADLAASCSSAPVSFSFGGVVNLVNIPAGFASMAQLQHLRIDGSTRCGPESVHWWSALSQLIQLRSIDLPELTIPLYVADSTAPGDDDGGAVSFDMPRLESLAHGAAAEAAGQQRWPGGSRRGCSRQGSAGRCS
jgi:hypothetical protein